VIHQQENTNKNETPIVEIDDELDFFEGKLTHNSHDERSKVVKETQKIKGVE